MFSKILNNFKKTDYSLPEFYQVDLHSHLIPQIDDGSKSMEQSIELIKELKSIGFKKLITTPHTMMHRFPNSKDDILRGFEKLQDEVSKQNIDIKLEVASEYYYDDHFIEQIRKKDLLTFGDNHILFEMSYTTPAFGLEQSVYELLKAGYKPILAHPERYTYFAAKPEKYNQLKDLGLQFQLNVNSTDGFYGKKPQQAAKYLIENSLIDFVGSDTHRPNYVEALKQSLGNKLFRGIEEKNIIKNNTL